MYGRTHSAALDSLRHTFDQVLVVCQRHNANTQDNKANMKNGMHALTHRKLGK